MPVIDEEQARAFIEKAYERVPEALTPEDAWPGGDACRRAAGARRAPRHARGDRRCPAPHPQRRSRLRQLGADRHGPQGGAGRGGAELFEAWSATSRARTCPRPSRRRPGRASRPERIGAGTIYHHRAWRRLDAGRRAAARWRHPVNGRHPARALLDRLSPAPERPPPSHAPPRRWPPLADPRSSTARWEISFATCCDREAAAAAAGARRQPLCAGRANGAQVPHRDQSAQQSLRRRHRRQRLRQESQPRGHQRAVRRSRGSGISSAATGSPAALVS